MDQKPALVLFDGVCNLCNASVDRLVRTDRNKRLRYASLQSEGGQHLLRALHLSVDRFDTFILVHEGRAFVRSDAALRVFQLLGGWWRILSVFFLVPRPIRDSVYSMVARNRYKWFGKKSTCRLPSPEERALFMESPGAIANLTGLA